MAKQPTDSPWFSHDAIAHRDEKLEALVSTYGWEGYGWWWVLVERMRLSDQICIDLSRATVAGSLTKLLGLTLEKLTQFCEDCVAFELLQKEGQIYWSKGLAKRLDTMKGFSERQAAAGRMGMAVRWAGHKAVNNGDTNGNDNAYIGDSITVNNKIHKEREKERGERETNSLPLETTKLQELQKEKQGDSSGQVEGSGSVQTQDEILIAQINEIRKPNPDDPDAEKPKIVNAFERGRILLLLQGHGFEKVSAAITAVGERGWYATPKQIADELSGSNERSGSGQSGDRGGSAEVSESAEEKTARLEREHAARIAAVHAEYQTVLRGCDFHRQKGEGIPPAAEAFFKRYPKAKKPEWFDAWVAEHPWVPQTAKRSKKPVPVDDEGSDV